MHPKRFQKPKLFFSLGFSLEHMRFRLLPVSIAISVAFFLLPGLASAATNIYYSVGQNTTDHKTGSPTLTISSGVGTFSVAQTATNMGVGDKVTYNTSSSCFISGKTSTSVWSLITATGAACPDVTDATVDSIGHAFSSLSAAVGGASPGAAGASYLNTANLVTGNFILNIPTYYDTGADTTAVTINGWTTGSSNYIKIYTPNNTSVEVNQGQRHSGTWDNTKYNLQVTDNNAILVQEDYVQIEGLQISTISPTANAKNMIRYASLTAGTNREDISYTILKGHNNSTYFQYAIDANTANINLNIWNIISYNVNTTLSNGYSLFVNQASATINVYSSTFIGGYSGIRQVAGTINCKNTYVGGVGSSAYVGTINKTTCASSDATGSTGLQNVAINTTNFTNVTSGSEDLHIPSGSSSLVNTGTDTSGDSAPLNFTDDIDGATRTGIWDVGADEYVAPADSSSPNVTAFTIPSTATSLTVAISSFTATDNVGVIGYLINESASIPALGDANWSVTAQTEYTFSSSGSKTAYAWAKDAAGNISNSATASVNITLTLEVGSGQAYSTIAAAVTAANAGDIINVHSGTYTENPALSKSVTLQANTGDSPSISGNITVTANDVTIDGFSITGWTGANNGVSQSGYSGLTVKNNTINGGGILTESGSCIYVRNSSRTLINSNTVYGCRKGINSNSSQSTNGTYTNGTIISNNTIHDNPVDGIDIHGQYITISGNTIYNNIDTNFATNHPDGIQGVRADVDGFSNVTYVKIYNNLIYNHTQNIFIEGWGTADPSDSIYIWNNVLYNEISTVNGVDMSTLGAAGIVLKGVDNAWVYSNYVGRHGGLLLHVQTQDAQLAGGMHIKNNIFTNSYASGGYPDIEDINAVSSGELNNNIYNIAANTKIFAGGVFYSSLVDFQTANPTLEVNGLALDPLVNSLPTPTLQAGSPAINSGATLADVSGISFAADYSGTSRPQGLAWDIGAYEYITSDTTPPTITAFTIPSISNSLTVSISSFTATDNTAVTGYLVNESATTPSVGDAGWSGTAQTSYTFSTAGSKTLYAWAKDGANNISASLNDIVTVDTGGNSPTPRDTVSISWTAPDSTSSGRPDSSASSQTSISPTTPPTPSPDITIVPEAQKVTFAPSIWTSLVKTISKATESVTKSSSPSPKPDLSKAPKEILTLAQKFPGLMKSLEKLAQSGGNVVESLKVAKLSLPPATNGVPISSLSRSDKASLPSEVVFAKSGDLIDHTVSISVTDDGRVEQRLNTVAGEEIQLALKPEFPAKEIKGYVMVDKMDRQQAKAVKAGSLLAAPFASLLVQESKKSPAIEKKLVLDSFTYSDTDKDGIYTAKFKAPLVHGQYDIMTIITYKDVALGSKELHLITVVDPEGYVYRKTGSDETRVQNAKVSLLWKNSKTGSFEEWPATKYNQTNPQKTDKTGMYSFLVPEGSYKLSVTSQGYYDYAGKEFEVVQGGGVHENIELKQKKWWKSIWRTIFRPAFE